MSRFRARAAAELRAGVPLSVADLAVGGKDVLALLQGVAGRQVGEALRLLLDEVLENPERNTRAHLSERLRGWWAARPADPEGAGTA